MSSMDEQPRTAIDNQYVTPLDLKEGARFEETEGLNTRVLSESLSGLIHADLKEEGPQQTFEEKIEETRHALFHTYSADPGPIGEDAGYVSPAHRWLGMVQEAAAKLMEAAEQALLEMPPSLKREAKKAHWVSDGWQSVAEGGAPEARRLMQVRAVAMLLNGLVDELANEGRPVAPFKLKVKVEGR